MFIERLKFQSDIATISSELEKILAEQTWEPYNQIGLTRRGSCNQELNNKWLDGCGSLYRPGTEGFIAEETEFNVWNIDHDWYTRQQIEQLSDDLFALARVRFMLLKPKTGLSVHQDREYRYHLVLKTNEKSYVAYNNKTIDMEKSQLVSESNCYHIPADGYWYRVDTRCQHWVYNGGNTDRIHLVVCGD